MVFTLLKDADFSTYASGAADLITNNGFIDTRSVGYAISGGVLDTGNGGIAFPPLALLRRPTTEKYINQKLDLYFVGASGAASGKGLACALRLTDDSNQYYYFAVDNNASGGNILRVSGGSTIAGTIVASTPYTAYTAGHTYKATATAVTSAGVTTLTLVVQDLSASTTILSLSGTDSTAALQVAGSYAIGRNNGPYSVSRLTLYQDDPTQYMSASPATLTINTTANTVNLTGVNVGWTAGNPGSPTFTLSGGTGASITSQTVSNATAATLTINAGSASGPLTITDSASGVTTTVSVANSAITINDSNIISSPYNTEFNSSSWVQSNCCGWYQRFKLTGATYLYATFDVSTLVSQGATSGQYPWVGAIVNNKLVYNTQLTSTTSEVLLANSLSGTSEVIVYFQKTGSDTLNKWTASGNNAIRISGYRSDGTLVSVTPRPKRLVAFGDSITQGNVNGNALEVPGALLGLALNAEYGQIGFGSQGWNHVGDGSVPIFGSAWNLQRSGVSRSFAIQPDYIVLNQGTNDSLNGISDTTVTTNATATLQAMRTACPMAWIFVVVPFGQFKQTALANAVTAVNDRKIVLIDLSVEASRGLTAFGLGASLYSVDGIHPSTYNNGRLGTMLAAAIQAKLSASVSTKRVIKL